MSALIPENIEELVAEYKRIWPLMPRLHAEIAKLADKNAIKTCAKRLGLYSTQGGRPGLFFAHDYEAELFQDYLIYAYKPRGFSLVRQMYNRKRYADGSDEQQLLARMVQARYSTFWVEELDPAGGMIALDVITGKKFFILDQSLPHQDVKGLLAAFRIFPFHGAWMHSGANTSFGIIHDPGALQPAHRTLDEKEELLLNEGNFHRWRNLMRDQD